MTLKKKLVVLLLVTGGILILLLYGAFQVTLYPSLQDQKLIFIETLKKKLHIALSIEEKNIDFHCSNWVKLESMEHYVINPYHEFEKEMFPDMIFTDEIIDFVLVLKIAQSSSDEEILFFKGYKNKKFLNLTHMNITSEIQRIKELIKQKRKTIENIIISKAGPLLTVANPIVVNDKLTGVLVMGRFIDKKMVEKLSQFVLEDIRSYSPDIHIIRTFHLRNMKRKDLYYKEDEDKLFIYYLIKDIHNRPGMILYARADNRLFQVVTQNFIFYLEKLYLKGLESL